MWPYIIRRMLWGIPILFGVTFMVFMGLHVMKGSPAAAFVGKAATQEQIDQFDEKNGFDKSYPAQYWDYVGEVVTMDFGRSWKTDRPVSEMIADGAGKSVSLTMPALVFTSLISICLALIASFFRGRKLDRGVMLLAVMGMSISFLVYIVVLQYLLAFLLPLFQIHGYEPGFGERWQFLVLPIMIQVIVGMGYDTRFYRSVFVEEVNKDHITTAYAKGASKRRVMFVHVLKNALIPIITRIMISIPFLVTGSLLLEQFFGIPGIGSMLLAALDTDDFPVIKALSVLISIIFIISTILNDVLYAVVDPRVRLK
jgi:peptide/nickel transport system permease protein